MRLPSPAISGTCRVPADHLTRSPPGQPHQVLLLATSGKPTVRHGVPEPVRVQMINPGLTPTTLQHLTDTGVGKGSAAAQPEGRGAVSQRVAAPGLQVLTERL